jgi:hypothetical protein
MIEIYPLNFIHNPAEVSNGQESIHEKWHLGHEKFFFF